VHAWEEDAWVAALGLTGRVTNTTKSEQFGPAITDGFDHDC